MGIFGDKPEQTTNIIQDENWFERDQFETVEEYQTRLTSSRLLAGKAALLRYDIEKVIFPLQVEWNMSAKSLIKNNYFVMKINKEEAKALYDLHRDNLVHLIYLKLVIDTAGFTVEQLELKAFDKYFNCSAFSDKQAWEEAFTSEKNLWQFTQNKNTLQAYKDYLNQSILHDYDQQAKENIRVVVWLIKAIKRTSEKNLWRSTQNKNTLQAYKDYLNQSILHDYDQQAKENINTIKRTKEEKLWQKACRENTEESYQYYLQQTELKTYSEQANAAVLPLQEEKLWQNACRKNTEESYQYYLQHSQLKIRNEQDISQSVEENLWRNACLKNAEESYKHYLQHSQLKTYSEQANTAILQLQEEKLWREACHKNTEESYQYYLQHSQLKIRNEQDIVKMQQQLQEKKLREETREAERLKIRRDETIFRLICIISAMYIFAWLFPSIRWYIVGASMWFWLMLLST